MKAHPYLITAICALALSAGATKMANAITRTVNFTATGFCQSLPPEVEPCTARPPTDPVRGTFTITLDTLDPPKNTQIKNDGGTNTIALSVNLSLLADVSFTYQNHVLEVCG